MEAEVDNQIFLVESVLKEKRVDIKTKFNKTKVEIRNRGVLSLGESTGNQLRIWGERTKCKIGNVL